MDFSNELKSTVTTLDRAIECIYELMEQNKELAQRNAGLQMENAMPRIRHELINDEIAQLKAELERALQRERNLEMVVEKEERQSKESYENGVVAAACTFNRYLENLKNKPLVLLKDEIETGIAHLNIVKESGELHNFDRFTQ